MYLSPAKTAYVLAATAVLLWSTVATAFKLSLYYLTPLQLVFGATLASLTALLCLAVANGTVREYRMLKRNDVLKAALLGFLNPFLYYVVLFEAYKRLPAQIAQPVNYSWVLMLALFSSLFLGQKLSRAEWAAMAFAYFGIVLIATGGRFVSLGGVDPLGIALCLASTLIWAAYWVLNTTSCVSPAVNLSLTMLLGLPWIVGLLWFSGQRLWPFPGAALAGAAYVGLFEMGITSVLWLTALKRADKAARVATLVFFSPFISLIWFSLILGESIKPSTLAGLACIALGAFAQQRIAARRAPTL